MKHLPVLCLLWLSADRLSEAKSLCDYCKSFTVMHAFTSKSMRAINHKEIEFRHPSLCSYVCILYVCMSSCVCVCVYCGWSERALIFEILSYIIHLSISLSVLLSQLTATTVPKRKGVGMQLGNVTNKGLTYINGFCVFILTMCGSCPGWHGGQAWQLLLVWLKNSYSPQLEYSALAIIQHTWRDRQTGGDSDKNKAAKHH